MPDDNKLNLSNLRLLPSLPMHSDPATTDAKPGYKSTEFWLSTAATLVGILLASGFLSPDDPQEAKMLRLLGLVASILVSLGYTASRTSAKNRAVEGATMVALARAGAVDPPLPPAA